jgi:hypothetical protein
VWGGGWLGWRGWKNKCLRIAKYYRVQSALQNIGTHDALKPGSRYLFDKLLHNDYALQPARLGLPDTLNIGLCL